MMSVLIAFGVGCGASAPRLDNGQATSSELPPAYTRDKIIDPKLADIARSFTAWVEDQKNSTGRIFSKVEVLPPAPTLLPYGIGTNQKEMRFPAILITGPGWPSLKLGEREAMADKVFENLTAQLSAIAADPPVRPSLTIQTPQGLELAWINAIEPDGKYLHGELE